MARRGKYLHDFAQRLLTTSEHVFLAQFPYPVLVGRGLVGRVGEAPVGSKRRTLRALKSQEQLASKVFMGRVWPIRKEHRHGSSNPISIGQAAASDITVAEYSLSARHAGFTFDHAGRLLLCDFSSLNGTFVNGEALPPDKAKPIRNDDSVAFGRLRFQFLTAQGFFEEVFRLAYGCETPGQKMELDSSSGPRVLAKVDPRPASRKSPAAPG